MSVDVFVGGKPAKVDYKGRSGCCAGLDQIVVEVPAGIEGCYVPVAVRVGDRVSNFVTMSIAAKGTTCPDLDAFPPAALDKLRHGDSLRLADVLLARLNVKVESPGLTSEATSDFGVAAFTSYEAFNLTASLNAGSFSATGAPLAAGTCTVLQQESLDLPFPTDLGPLNPDRPKYLKAGPAVNVTGPKGAKSLGPLNDRYLGQLGGLCLFCEDPTVDPEYLVPGAYTIDNGAGGQDVVPFQASLTVPGPLKWTNRDGLTDVPRDHDLTLTWSAGDSDQQLVTVFGFSAPDSSSGSGAVLLCAAAASTGQLTIPSWVLSAMPASATSSGLPEGFLGLMNSSPPSASVMSVPGMDVGRIQYGILQLNGVSFR